GETSRRCPHDRAPAARPRQLTRPVKGDRLHAKTCLQPTFHLTIRHRKVVLYTTSGSLLILGVVTNKGWLPWFAGQVGRSWLSCWSVSRHRRRRRSLPGRSRLAADAAVRRDRRSSRLRSIAIARSPSGCTH